jgi:HAD superfamily hydrolase (TIGR01509 family)
MQTAFTAPWGAIFDWDGVIVDSRRHHEESWERLGREEKRVLPEGHFIKGFGRKNDYIIPEILGWTHDAAEIERISLRKEALYRDVVGDWGIEPLPGVREWLSALQEARVPCAVGSSTHRANIDLSLGLMGLKPFFAEIVSAEDVTRGKPDPQVFLAAARKIEREPSRGVVFGDGHVGIEAARAGGIRVVAVATTHPRGELAMADCVVVRMDELDVADIGAWLCEKR